MRRVLITFATAAVAWTATACGGGEVAVVAHLQQQTEMDETEASALSNLPVRLLPFDRDAVFDSLEAAFPEPEPEIPDSIFDLQERVVEAQQEWQQAETRWGVLRDSLQGLADRMANMDESSDEYYTLFQDFNDLESEVSSLEQTSSSAFEEFDELQRRLTTQSREITIARQNWADEAFATVDSIFLAREEEVGREVQWDTTSVDGLARFTGVPAGQWWISARYERQFDELYWNVPVQVEGGETTEVELTEDNAEVRQIM
ncbi:MAG: hypothetical protein ACOC5I_01115 [Gemmatimonadota bacterium]